MTASRSDLLQAPPAELMAAAAAVRAAQFRTRVTYSPKVFIPLTMLCRDRCGYCTFAKAPARVTAPYLLPEEVLAVAEARSPPGRPAARLTPGARPRPRYPPPPARGAAAGPARRCGSPRRA